MTAKKSTRAKSSKGGAPVERSALEVARDEWPTDDDGNPIPNANGWTPPDYDGDPNLTRGGMRTGTAADFHVDYDDGHNMQAISTADDGE